MKYRIKKIKSKKEEAKAIIFCLIIAVFFICLGLNSFYGDHNLPEFVFEIHRKLP